jgi:hypothetical protein
MAGPVRIALEISDPTGLWEAAFASYTGAGCGTEEAAWRTLGTRSDPFLRACVIEVIADRDREGFFDFVD